MRRMKEQQAVGGGGMNMMGNMPEMFNLVVNTNHPMVTKLVESKGKKQSQLAKSTACLANCDCFLPLLSTNFVTIG
jgi:molecular chaperone HtpG